MKLKFNKDIYDTEIKPICPGSEIANEVSLSLDENGNECLVAKEYNIQQVIDSYAEECSIARILISHGLGDELALNKDPGVYLDKSQVDFINKYGSSSEAQLTAQLLDLYKDYKDQMSFEVFAKAVKTGDYQALTKNNKPNESKEEVNNA